MAGLWSGNGSAPGKESGGFLSPDGSQILYYWDGNGDPSKAGYWVVALDGSTEALVLPDPPGSDMLGGADWSPDGTQLVYQLNTGAWQGVIRVVNLDGSGDHLLLQPFSDNTYVSPCDWHGSTIVL